MCTVSVIRPAGDPHLRVVVNRDERRTRPRALPPIVVRTGGRRATMPVDPVGAGSWVAVNDAGIVFTLLNGVDAAARIDDAKARSRGQIVTNLIASVSLREVASRLSTLDLSGYRPWRLIAATTMDFLDVHSEFLISGLEAKPLPPAFVATSSSFLPDEANRLRTALFDEMVAEPDARAQDAFHLHQWRDRPELSVRMERPEARTVSRTVIELTRRNARLHYRPLS